MKLENSLEDLKFTAWEMDIINHFFNQQLDQNNPCAYAIKSDLKVFEAHRFKLTLDELIFQGVSPIEIYKRLGSIEKQAEQNSDIWNDQLSKIDKIRKGVEITGANEFPIPVKRIEIIYHINEYRYNEHGFALENELHHKNEKIYFNFLLYKYSSHVLKVISDLNPNSTILPSLEYIKPEYREHLTVKESKIPGLINAWKSGLNKIECAAFCELLFENKFFIKKSTRVKSVNSFSLSRYSNEISIQLESGKNEERKVHKTRLQRLFLIVGGTVPYPNFKNDQTLYWSTFHANYFVGNLKTTFFLLPFDTNLPVLLLLRLLAIYRKTNFKK